MRRIGGQNAFTDLFEAGSELHVLLRAGSQFDIGDAVIFQTDVNHQFVGIVLDGFHKQAGFKLRIAHAHIADHGFNQREAPQRLRNIQRFALGAVDKQLEIFSASNPRRPVRISNAGAAHGHQIVTMIQPLLRIRRVDHAANAHHRDLSQGIRAQRTIFFNQRRRIAGIDNRGTQRCADGEVQIVETARRQFFQQVQGVIKTDTRLFQLFRGEAIADNKGIIGVLARHFMGNVEDRQRETRTVVAAAAPLIIALVRIRGIELLDKIGVSAVNFHAIKTGQNGATYTVAEFGNHSLNFFAAQRTRHRSAFARCGQRARRHRLTAADQLRIDHTPAVIDLQNRF